ncbi:MAG: hypothetical protein JJT81_05345, partial [Rubellimicrobium sp.]|nr:hypothetical protein [Rubellimicrobium sp.]
LPHALPGPGAVRIRDSDCHEGASAATADGLDQDEIGEFARSVWFVRGGEGELLPLYSLGLAFDEIVTAQPAQIEAMQAVNPRVAERMSVVDWVAG